MKMIDVITNSPSQILDKGKNTDMKEPTKFVAAIGSIPVNSLKHDRDEEDHLQNKKPTKKQKMLPADDNAVMSEFLLG
jgi:hypothetical protein